MTSPVADRREPRPAARPLPGDDPWRHRHAARGRPPGRAAARPGRSRRPGRAPGRGRVDGEVVARPGGPVVRVRGRPRRDPARPRPPGRRCPASRRPTPARLPRHRDDRARDGGRDGRLPRRPRLVGGRPRSARSSCCCPTTPTSRRCSTALAGHIPPDAWLVTYNGRGFDWPLLVARYRMARRAAPLHAGHLDLLPFVRRVFRHRMTTPGCGRSRRTLLGHGPPRRRRRLGDPRALPRLPARRPGRAAGRGRPPQRRGRPLAGPAPRSCSTAATPTPRRGGRAPAGDLGRPRPRVRPGAAASTRRSSASTRRSSRAAPAPAPSHAPIRRDRWTRDATPDPPARSRGGRRARRPDFGGRPRPHIELGARRSGRRPSPLPGRPTGSPSSAPTCSAGSAATTRRPTPGRAWPPARAGSRSSAWIELAKLREHRLARPARRARGHGRRPRPRRAPATARASGAAPRGATCAPRLERLRRRLVGAGPRPSARRGATSGRRGSGVHRLPSAPGPSRASGSNEQAIVRRSPASALR